MSERLRTGLIAVLFLVSVLVLPGCIDWPWNNGDRQDQPRPETMQVAEDRALERSSASVSSSPAPAGGDQSGETNLPDEVSIKEGSVEAEVADPDDVIGRLDQLVNEHDGFIEEQNRRQSESTLRWRATVRVPSDRFDTVMRSFEHQFDVQSINRNDHRLSIRHSVDETQILSETLDRLEQLESRINNVSELGERMDLLMELNEHRTQLVRQLKRHERRIQQAQNRSKLATINVTITYDRPVTVEIPEFQNEQVRQINRLLESIRELTVKLPLQTVMVVLTGIKWFVYIIAFLLPFYAGFRAIGWWFEEPG